MADITQATWPEAAITYGTWAWLRREISGYLDFGYDFPLLDPVQQGKVLSALQSGMQQYYFPPPLEGQSSHSWSFLNPLRRILLVSSANTVQLPSDCTGVIGDFTYQTALASGLGSRKVISTVAELDLRQRAIADPQSGPPQYAAIRPVHAGNVVVNYEVVFYPTPGTDEDGLAIEYRSQITPASPVEETDYANKVFGNPNHRELCLASCLAVAEQRYKSGPGTYSAKYLQDLKSAIAVDLIALATSETSIWPTQDFVYGTYDWLRRELGGFLKFGYDVKTWNATQAGKVISYLQSGLRQYYFPPPVVVGDSSQPPHRWSFLSPVQTVTLSAGISTVSLPEDFAGIIGDLTIDSTSGSTVIPIVPEAQLRQRQSSDPQGGRPLFAAVRPVQVSGVKVTHELVFYPTPSADEAGLLVSYRAVMVPTSITAGSDFSLPIFGGPNHAELILASCLSIAEQRDSGTSGVHTARFKQELTSALQVDIDALKPNESSIWPTRSIDYGTLGWLRREIGGYLKYGFDVNGWNATQRGRVLSIIQSGAMQFYFPPPQAVGEGQESKPPHQWSFLVPVRTVGLSTGQATYPLPIDFTGIIGDLTWQSGSTTQAIPIVAESKLRQLVGNTPLSGQPKYAAIRPVSITGIKVTHELLLYPTPGSDEASSTLEYRSQVVPAQVAEDSDFTQQVYGSQQHAEILLASCLAVAEHRESGGPGQCAAKYTQQLGAAIQNDVLALISTEDAIWPVEQLADTLRINKSYLKRLIGRQLKFGPHPGAWNHKQASEVAIVLDRGLRQFYDPVIVNAAYTHEWSFMRPLYDLTTITDQFQYDLPEDFVMLYGPILFAPETTTLMEPLEEVPLYKVRQWLQQTTSGRPRICGINSRPIPDIGGIRWELWLAPKPDQEYVLTLPYKANPLAMAEDTTLPYGGQEHHETLIEACLAAAEAFVEKKGMHADRFITLLAASISRDQKSSSPEMLGYNRDPSDRPIFNQYNRWHGMDQQTVTYNGDVIPLS